MQAKIILQKLWTLKLNWDESVPADIHTLWSILLEEITRLRTLSVPRKVVGHFPSKSIELHGFCDASQLGYGACIYVRSTDDDKNYTSKLLCAKSRVVPLKSISLPRLELCGALLLAHLIGKARQSIINLQIQREILWTDSTIVLAWINSSSSNLKVFVANRVAKIQSLTSPSDWRHTKSENNAADILSRGCSPRQLLQKEQWFDGPSFLKYPEHDWPRSEVIGNNKNQEITEKRVTLVAANKGNDLTLVLNKFSNFYKLQRVFEFILRFIHNSKSENQHIKQSGNLTCEELKKSERTIVKLMQMDVFYSELNQLKNGKQLDRRSKLLSLSPFLDKDGIIRVGGRLKNACISNDVKYPIILPKNHVVTKLLIEQVHERHLHAGPQATLTALRQRFWIIAGRSVIRQILYRCIKCFKANPKRTSPKMGDLPATRIIQPCRPFLITGTDYAGPILVKESRGRGKRLIKAYIAIFICFSTKAVHIELVTDLSTEEFLAAFKRFIGRRGLPTDVYSDNGTNFVGANSVLIDLIKFFRKEEVKNSIQGESSKLGIRWHFTPPKSPHMGGLWESNIKSIKKHLKRTVGTAKLTLVEMNTFLVRVEACLNSRPLTPLSHDPCDLQVLTPGHFLIGQPLTELPEYNLKHVPENRLGRWQLVERIRSHFWKRWNKEYLTQLQVRPKWRINKTSPLEVGEMVILIDDNTPPLCWKVGRITETHPGLDDNVRVVTVRTSQGDFKRAAHKVCRLPMEEN